MQKNHLNVSRSRYLQLSSTFKWSDFTATVGMWIQKICTESFVLCNRSLTVPHRTTCFSSLVVFILLCHDISILLNVLPSNIIFSLLVSIMLHVLVPLTDCHQALNTYLKHKYVCELNIINLWAHKFYNLVLNFVTLNGNCLFSCIFHRLKYFWLCFFKNMLQSFG